MLRRPIQVRRLGRESNAGYHAVQSVIKGDDVWVLVVEIKLFRGKRLRALHPVRQISGVARTTVAADRCRYPQVWV